ncbi:MAG: beta-N-acetylhexosaminidase [Glaciecola sp.]
MHPIMLDVAGFELTQQEQEVMAHPLTGGVILFARNYHDPDQLRHLTSQIKRSAGHPILIAVDQEGGRVQRFKNGFTAIPAMGDIEHHDHVQARQLAYACGRVIATECIGHGVDISFAPVLDINAISEVIGTRSFSNAPSTILSLATEFIHGLKAIGMPAIGKHFPGHGNVKADSHIAMPSDERSKDTIFELDMAIFTHFMQQQLIDGIMPAHVVYPDIDSRPAGFSSIWLQQILRQHCGFQGVIFSDDLSMHAASEAGSMLDRVEHALAAGVDMALICNAPDEAIMVLDNLGHSEQRQASYSQTPQKLISIEANGALNNHQQQRRHYSEILKESAYQEAVTFISSIFKA